jgi:ribosomal protein S6--L-glutamate ligase
MILSFHPIFSGDSNLICAGRAPGTDEFAAIRAAAAVILPQGCRRDLYEMARDNCARVFPNYDVRFKYPGKIGQIRLFRETGVRHPHSVLFRDLKSLRQGCRKIPEELPHKFPFVFKFDWGGEGETVFLIRSAAELTNVLHQAAAFEQTGQKGFILQEHINTRRRCLRAVVIGRRYLSYWRIQPQPEAFQVSLAKGARIDTHADPQLQALAIHALKRFNEITRINLAGFDFLFSTDPLQSDPYFLEVNYYFGRTGLGGTEAYYRILTAEIHDWLASHGLRVKTCESHSSQGFIF